MTLNGIDISSYQSNLDLNNIVFDFVLIKATEGTDYINPSCDRHFQQAKALGKKIGVYHYANGNDPIAEADWFFSNCSGYANQAIFVLDWEGDGTEYTVWALKFLQRLESKLGYKPAIYMSESVVNANDWSAVVAGDYGLWVAKYAGDAPDYNYNMSAAGPEPTVKWWEFFFMWQWSSTGRIDGYDGNLDCNIFYGDKATWDRYAGVQAIVEPVPEPTTTTTTTKAPTPVPVKVTTTTTTVVPTTTTTTEATPVETRSLWSIIILVLVKILNRLRGK